MYINPQTSDISNNTSSSQAEPISTLRRAEPQFHVDVSPKPQDASNNSIEPVQTQSQTGNSMQDIVFVKSKHWPSDYDTGKNRIANVLSGLINAEMFSKQVVREESSSDKSKVQNISTDGDSAQVQMKDENHEEVESKTEGNRQQEENTVSVQPNESFASVLLKAFPEVGSEEFSIPSKGRILFSFILCNYAVFGDQYKKLSKNFPTRERLESLYKESLRENNDALYELIDIVNESGSVIGDKEMTIQIPGPRDMLDTDSQLLHSQENVETSAQTAASGNKNQAKKSFWGLFGGM